VKRRDFITLLGSAAGWPIASIETTNSRVRAYMARLNNMRPLSKP
jgi:hypothetical protein